jgi:hypothetical protein
MLCQGAASEPGADRGPQPGCPAGVVVATGHKRDLNLGVLFPTHGFSRLLGPVATAPGSD